MRQFFSRIPDKKYSVRNDVIVAITMICAGEIYRSVSLKAVAAVDQK